MNNMTFIRKSISLLIAFCFILTSLPKSYAQEAVLVAMPKPGTMVALSPQFMPAHLQGLIIHPDNALRFDFLIHRGDQNLQGTERDQEYKKLVKYFLASLTIPDENQWVNLSPYEKQRIIEGDFGNTEMGRDLLAQDYLLKQITSSMVYPDSQLGKKFWDKVYERAWKEFHTNQVPVNTFNKVWITPDDAVLYEKGETVYVLRNHLKVMLEEDYLSLDKHNGIKSAPQNDTHTIASKIIKEIVLPELEKEVNEGKNFANLRQIYSAMILATWFKKALKESLLGKVYANQAKVKGVNQDPKNNELIYKQYLQAFRKGVFNYIKEETDEYSKQVIPRKYFSGGADNDFAAVTKIINDKTPLPSNLKSELSDFAATTNLIDQAAINVVPDTQLYGYREQDQRGALQALVRSLNAFRENSKDEGIKNRINTALEKIAEEQDLKKARSYLTDLIKDNSAFSNPQEGNMNLLNRLLVMEQMRPLNADGQRLKAAIQEDLKTGNNNYQRFRLEFLDFAIKRGEEALEPSSIILSRDDFKVDMEMKADENENNPAAISSIVKAWKKFKTSGIMGYKEFAANYYKRNSDVLRTYGVNRNTIMQIVLIQEESHVTIQRDTLRSSKVRKLKGSGNEEDLAMTVTKVFGTGLSVALLAWQINSFAGWDYKEQKNPQEILSITQLLEKLKTKEVFEPLAFIYFMHNFDNFLKYRSEDEILNLKKNKDQLLKLIDSTAMSANEKSSTKRVVNAILDSYRHGLNGYTLKQDNIPQYFSRINDDGTRELLEGSNSQKFNVRTGKTEGGNTLSPESRKDAIELFKEPVLTIEEMLNEFRNSQPLKDAVSNPTEEKIIFSYLTFLLNRSEENVLTLKNNLDTQLKFVDSLALRPNDKITLKNKITYIFSNYTHGDWGYRLGDIYYGNALLDFYRPVYSKESTYEVRVDGGDIWSGSPEADTNHRIEAAKLLGVPETKWLNSPRAENPQTNETIKKLSFNTNGEQTEGDPLGGIDLNAANLNLIIKRDGKGVPLPLDMQDMEKLKSIDGFVPQLIEVKPAVGLPVFAEIQAKLKS